MVKVLKKQSCRECGKLLDRKHLSVHLRIHTGEKPFICEFCGKRFAINGNLTKHKKKHHFHEMYTCVDCKSQFSCASSLSRHRTEAEIKNPFQCGFCCSSFKRLHNLLLHQTKVHSRREGVPDNNQFAESLLKIRKEKQTMTTPETERPSTSGISDANKTLTMTLKRKQDDDEYHVIIPKKSPTPQSCGSTDSNQDLHKENSPTTSTDHVFQVAYIDRISVNEVESSADEGDGSNNHQVSNETPGISDNEDPSPLRINDSHDFTLKEPVLKLSSIKNADETLFITESWKLTKTRQKLQKTLESYGFGEQVLEFLSGQKLQWTLASMIEFLTDNPQKIIGDFLSSLMLIDFCVRNHPTSVFELYNRSEEFSPDFRPLVEKLTTYIAQRKLRQDISNLHKANDIPTAILENLKFDFIPLAAKLGCMQTQILTPTESKFLARVTSSLTDSLFSDSKRRDIAIMDDNFQAVERAHLWITVLNNYMNGWVKGEEGNFFTLVLQSNLRRCDGTRPYFKVTSENKEVHIHLHERVVRKFCDIAPSDCPPINATRTDVQVFQNLLYKEHKPSDYKGIITFGVYKIAEIMKVKNIDWFLFRNHDFQLYTDYHNKKDILKILIKLRKTELISNIAAIFNTWMPEHEVKTCLNGMEPDDVIFFLDQQSLNLEELLVYKITLQWAHANCNKKCENEMKVDFDPEVMKSFCLVRMVLRLADLQNHAHLLCQNNFISMYDIYVAAQFKSNTNKTTPEHFWFSTAPRRTILQIEMN